MGNIKKQPNKSEPPEYTLLNLSILLSDIGSFVRLLFIFSIRKTLIQITFFRHALSGRNPKGADLNGENFELYFEMSHINDVIIQK